MNKKIRFTRLASTLLCAAVLSVAVTSCATSQKSAKRPSSYSRQKTVHQPKWNASTSQTTTYYIKKHSTRKRHNP